MAVTNFHYITRMSSGFKVYILEGQPNLRGEDRFRHMTSERVRVLPAHPIKRKRSLERGLTLEERRERAISKGLSSGGRRASGTSLPESPSSTWSPTASPTQIIPSPTYSTPAMDEPLALIKKPRQDPPKPQDRTKSPSASNIQMRPSVITCISSTTKSPRRAEDCSGHSTVMSRQSCERVVEEHFQRSLGLDYRKASPQRQRLLSTVSVDDHFAKALGDKWLQIKASSLSRASTSSSPSSSSSPPSSPGYVHSPGYGRSPKRVRQDSVSPSTADPSRWSVK